MGRRRAIPRALPTAQSTQSGEIDFENFHTHCILLIVCTRSYGRSANARYLLTRCLQDLLRCVDGVSNGFTFECNPTGNFGCAVWKGTGTLYKRSTCFLSIRSHVQQLWSDKRLAVNFVQEEGSRIFWLCLRMARPCTKTSAHANMIDTVTSFRWRPNAVHRTWSRRARRRHAWLYALGVGTCVLVVCLRALCSSDSSAVLSSFSEGRS